MSILGAMMFEEAALVQAFEILRSDYFYEENHRRIFEALQALFEKNRPADLVTVAEELKRKNSLEEVGGLSYLTQLTAIVPTSAHVEHYAHIVKEKALLRNLIENSTKIVGRCFEAESDVSNVLDEAEKMIFDISQHRIQGKVFSFREIIHDSMETIDRLYQRKEHITGLATGFHEFDTKTAGLQPSDLIVVAGRPSMGKSAFV